MIDALRISIGDITYENVKIILSPELEDMGFDPIFEEHTIMFRQGIKWHACHDWSLKMIHVSRNNLRLPHLLPFERLVIDGNKIYGPGMFATNKVLVNYGIDEIWHHRLERQVAFSCLEGIFITTDYAIDNLIFQPGHPIKSQSTSTIVTHGVKSTDIVRHIGVGGTRPCRSERKVR